MYKQNAVRGKVEPADIRIPTASHGGGVYSTVEVKNMIFNDFKFDKHSLSSHIRSDGTRRFFQCLDVLFKGHEPLVFVDVGGCTGELIRAFSEYDKDSKIYCVEPNSHLAHKLKTEFHERVDVENIGLGEETGKGKLHITERPQFSSKLTPDGTYGETSLLGLPNKYKNGALRVKAIEEFDIWKGDDYFASKNISSCDILSINTQGGEAEILDGFRNSLKKGAIKACKIEVDMQCRYKDMKGSSLPDIERIMAACDYRMFEILLIKQMIPVGIQLMDILYVHKSIDFKR